MFDDKAIITSVNTKTENWGEVLDYKRKKKLVVSINRSVRVQLFWDAKQKLYCGNVGAMEFTSEGPKELL
jgi:hypothetical protein